MHSLDIWPFIARPISPKANNVADFDMDGKPDNISFMNKRIKVHTEDALEDPSYRFPGNYGVEKFLEIFSGGLFQTARGVLIFNLLLLQRKTMTLSALPTCLHTETLKEVPWDLLGRETLKMLEGCVRKME